MQLTNYTPGVVESYDPATRLCRVSIPGITDGAEVFPEAMLSYPLGDKSEHTEIRIVVGDRVWLAFVNGDPRYPIIVGWRPKETDNAIAWRRWHHDNIELRADADMRLQAAAGTASIEAGANVTVHANGSVTVEASSITLRALNIILDGNATVTGSLTVQGLLEWLAGMAGAGAAIVNGVNVGSDHTHGGIKRDNAFSDTPGSHAPGNP